jgi:hypothetical protein
MNIRPSSHKIPAQARKRGNPNWGQPQTAPLAAMPTEFELHAKIAALNREAVREFK